MLKTFIASVVISLLAISASEISPQSTIPKNKAEAKSKSLKSVDFLDGQTGIERIVFTGLGPGYGESAEKINERISESDLKAELGAKGGSMIPKECDTLDIDRVGNPLRLIKEILANSGYFKANVVALGEKLGEGRMKLIFSINMGPAFTVKHLRFTGLHAFSNEELVAAMEQCLSDRWGIYDLRHIDYCRSNQGSKTDD